MGLAEHCAGLFVPHMGDGPVLLPGMGQNLAAVLKAFVDPLHEIGATFGRVLSLDLDSDQEGGIRHLETMIHLERLHTAPPIGFVGTRSREKSSTPGCSHFPSGRTRTIGSAEIDNASSRRSKSPTIVTYS